MTKHEEAEAVIAVLNKDLCRGGCGMRKEDYFGPEMQDDFLCLTCLEKLIIEIHIKGL